MQKSQKVISMLREAREEDFQYISLLQQENFLHEPWNMKAITEVMRLDGIKSFVSTTENIITAYIIYRIIIDECEIVSIAVADSFKQKKIGKSLLDRMVEEIKKSDVNVVHLEVAEDNTAAINMYKKSGFKESGKRPGYYNRGAEKPVNAILMKLTI